MRTYNYFEEKKAEPKNYIVDKKEVKTAAEKTYQAISNKKDLSFYGFHKKTILSDLSQFKTQSQASIDQYTRMFCAEMDDANEKGFYGLVRYEIAKKVLARIGA